MIMYMCNMCMECVSYYNISIGFKGQTMIYTKHFKLKIEQHERIKRNVSQPWCSGKVIISCSTEASVVF